MSLQLYKQKRHFDKTSEPAGKVKKSKPAKPVFVVQKHRASHLHYDFRLEMDGVLKSWAVPKGPSLKPTDRRLAMMVEDHPYDYRNFEGTIPKGNYGAGEVIVWDNGTYEPARPAADLNKELKAGLKKGHIDFVLHGKKLKGRFALIKKPNAEENAWLLVKKRDEHASDQDVSERVESVISGQVLEVDQKEDSLSEAPPAGFPGRVKPMLATLAGEPFDDKNWLYEIKWDGYRAIAGWDGSQAGLHSRNGNDFSEKYPPVYEAVRQLKRKAVLDGEIVAVDESGKSRFEWLQNYGRDPQGRLVYYVFDILWYEGRDLSGLPLARRKAVLKDLLQDNQTIRYSDHIVGNGSQFFEMAKDAGLEGIMAKRCESIYKENFRSREWLKIKTHMRQEAVIGGFTEPKGSRKHIGALLVGIYEDGRLRYSGHVGGGIPPKQAAGLRQRLEKLERKTSPFDQKVKPNSEVHWVKPELICEVTFAEWTKDGHMRQPIFVGLRSDKKQEEVKQELPMEKPQEAPESRVKLTHRDKVFWPEAGYTKGNLIDYYRSVADFIMPYLKNRPQSLLRMPNGYGGKSFFQKDAAGTVPDWAQTAAIYSESNQKDIHYLVCNTFEDLELMVQLGCIEINPWSSRLSNLHKPDWVVIDLDPEGISFKEVVKVALEVRKLCDELDIPSYPKTSGKTGIHIFIPTGAMYTYDQLKSFAEILANIIHDRCPDTTSVERSPKKRPNKIYIDFLQNREGQTLAAPYSVRPTKTASVSTPLDWDEVNAKLDPTKFTIKNTPKRIKDIGDIWRPVLGKGLDLKDIINKLS
jgi:bifunctional non-homologous end joining protein LigD